MIPHKDSPMLSLFANEEQRRIVDDTKTTYFKVMAYSKTVEISTYNDEVTRTLNNELDWQAYLRTRGLSADNPYVEHMWNAQKRKDLISLQQSAIEWDANQQAYAQQMEDSSPLANLLRQRQAGLNPDIATGSSGSSGSSLGTGAPQAPGLSQADTNLNDFYDIDDTLNIINTSANVLSSFSSALGAGFDFAQGIATFASTVKSAAATASIADSAAQVAQQTIPAQVKQINDSARLSAASANVAEGTEAAQIAAANTAADIVAHTKDDVVSQSRGSRILQQLGYISQIASVLVPDQNGDVSNDSVLRAAKNFGLTPEETALLQDYVSNPAYKALYDDQVVQARQSQSMNEQASFTWLDHRNKCQLAFQTLQLETQLHTQNFAKTVAALQDTLFNAQQESSNLSLGRSVLSSSLGVESQQHQLTSALLQREKSLFDEQVKNVSSIIQQIESELNGMKPLYLNGQFSPDQLALRRSYRVEINRLKTLNSQNLSTAYQSLLNFHRSASTFNALSTGQGQVLAGSLIGESPRVYYLETIFGNSVTPESTEVNTLFDKLLKFVK